MIEVMKKAQELAEAILASDVYQRMKQAEQAIGSDADATMAIASYMEKRDRVQQELGDQVDPVRLAELAADLQTAEDAMNAQPCVREMHDARQAFDEMMESINRVLRLVINGDPTEAESVSGCTGSCASCKAGCASRK